MIFFKEKFWEFPQYFQISSKISNFQRKILRISKDFIEIFFKFSLNFHSISKRDFWFCEIHLKIERNWEKKKLQKFIVRLTGEWKKAILENFGYFWIFFGKLTWFFDNFPFYNNSQNSIIHFLKLKKFRKNLEKKIVTKFRFLKILT